MLIMFHIDHVLGLMQCIFWTVETPGGVLFSAHLLFIFLAQGFGWNLVRLWFYNVLVIFLQWLCFGPRLARSGGGMGYRPHGRPAAMYRCCSKNQPETCCGALLTAMPLNVTELSGPGPSLLSIEVVKVKFSLLHCAAFSTILSMARSEAEDGGQIRDPKPARKANHVWLWFSKFVWHWLCCSQTIVLCQIPWVMCLPTVAMTGSEDRRKECFSHEGQSE